MVNPISNQQFSHDYEKFVFQDLTAIPLSPYGTPKIPFFVPSPKKTKKDLEKENRPFGIIKRDKEEKKDKNDANENKGKDKESI